MRISDWSSDVCSSDLGCSGDLGALCGEPALAFPSLADDRLHCRSGERSSCHRPYGAGGCCVGGSRPSESRARGTTGCAIPRATPFRPSQHPAVALAASVLTGWPRRACPLNGAPSFHCLTPALVSGAAVLGVFALAGAQDKDRGP